MLRVTWEWLGQAPSLDLANTVNVVGGVEHDMVAPPGEYDRWAAAEAAALALPELDAAALIEARPSLVALRPAIRAVLFADAGRHELPVSAVAELNRVSRAAPEWAELDAESKRVRRVAKGRRVARVTALYARSAMEQVVEAETALRVCPAPSCGMFYRARRADQHWCSTQCGTRARVARHARARRASARAS